MSSGPVYALNLFNVKDREEYLTYVRRSAKELPAHGGKVVAVGKYRDAEVGEIAPRQVLILVEWESRQALQCISTTLLWPIFTRTVSTEPPTTSGIFTTNWKTSVRF